MAIQVNYMTAKELHALAKSVPNSLLCLIGYEAPCPDWVPIGCPYSMLDMQPMTQVGYEVWTTTGAARYDAARRFAISRVPGLMMGLVEVDQLGSHSLADVAREAYGRVFDIICGAEQSLYRVWNYIPYIIDDEDGMERYRRFNTGRAEAFTETSDAPAVPPAASALGSDGGDMLIYFLAGDSEQIAIENPRQVSAFNYPPQYGPSSPIFSRATLVNFVSGSMLFISGTASIVGHESQHIDDIEEQTYETIRNLLAVISEAVQKGFTYSAERMRLKVYLRHYDHLETVQSILSRAFPELGGVMFIRAEICRKELLVEIEAVCSAK